jgi:hypothetical protein
MVLILKEISNKCTKSRQGYYGQQKQQRQKEQGQRRRRETT